MHISRFFIAGKGHKTKEQIEKIKDFINTNAHENYEFVIVDVLENPSMAYDDQVFATPRIIIVSPKQSRRVVGDISKPEKVAALLDITF